MNKTRVLIADDHPFFRAGVVHWLNHQPGLVCCGEAGSVAEIRQAVAAQQPDVLLLDLRLGDGDGLDLILELTQSHPSVRIIAVSQFDEQTHAHRALRSGARGYLMKSEAAESLAAAIKTVLQGQVYLSRTAHALLLANLFPDPGSDLPDLAELSDRELQIFQLIGVGCGPRAMSAQLNISPKTIESHREHIKVKLRLPDGQALRRAAVLWVQKGRLPTPPTRSA
jgi:DNA-binding NarL/FixJ family response regulator